MLVIAPNASAARFVALLARRHVLTKPQIAMGAFANEEATAEEFAATRATPSSNTEHCSGGPGDAYPPIRKPER